MGQGSAYLALDLGAESGRGLIARFDGERLSLDEVFRFPNGPVQMRQTLYWDLPRLWEGCKTALRKTAEEQPELAGIAVDTWGVDFMLLGRNGTLLGYPVHYRDKRTEGMMDRAFSRIPRERIYEITGLQFMPFNTVFQLLAMVEEGNPILEVAERLLMMPDVIGWLLTGRALGERTDCSTTQLLDPRTGTWSEEICTGLNIPRRILPDLIEPGEELGPLDGALAREVGLKGARVFATAGHDTAAAVAAVPVAQPTPGGKPDWCYISSGTWSLMGIESPAPIINSQTLKYNFTNEGGVLGTTRVLKNIMGLWLVQECKRTWAREGLDYSYGELVPRAYGAPPFAALVDPDDASFLAPGDMPARLAAFCERTGQKPPVNEGGFVRCALESLALKYRWVLEKLEEILNGPIRAIHIVGGGTRNGLLCQFTADACGRPVYAGPVEATAMGNVLMQAVGTGRIGTLAEGRRIVASSFPVTVYEPRETARWDEAAERFGQILERAAG